MNFKENITKKVNIADNDGLSSFKNFACQQHHDVYEVFFNFIAEVKPARILEIGTALGGFTSYLKEVVNTLNIQCNIRSYDIHRMQWYIDIINTGVDIRVENIFNSDWSEVDDEVVSYIQSAGPTIVLCDGGNKVGEFNTLSKYIKNKDFILAHDFSKTRDFFEENIKTKIWNWLEIEESNIQQACENYSLYDYNSDTFAKVVWACKQKNIN